MNYTKPALSFHDQAKLLITRGLLVKDSQDLETYLQQVNYYRLSGYWYIFKTTDPVSGEEKLKPGTTFEMIRNHYEFDRRQSGFITQENPGTPVQPVSDGLRFMVITLNYIRNSCAHHARLWNRPLPLAVKRPDPKHDSQWYQPVQIPNNNIFSVLTLIQYLLNFILPHNTWKDDVKHLLTSYPGISIRLMGFPQAWQDSPLWK